jgi:hypothetical protein
MKGSKVTFTAYVHDDDELNMFRLLIRMIEGNHLSSGTSIKVQQIKNVNVAIRRLRLGS